MNFRGTNYSGGSVGLATESETRWTEALLEEARSAHRAGTKTRAHSISVIVPVYNSQSILPSLVQRTGPVLESLAERYELVLVNDGSRDRSWEIIQELARQQPWVRGVNLMRNYGQHNALLCGIRAATGDILVTIDDDLQNPPEEIPALLSKFEEGYDVVYGTPKVEQHGLWRNIASRMTKLALERAAGAEVARNVSAFRLFRARLREAFTDYGNPYVSIDILLTWGTTRFAAIPVAHAPRKVGVSNYSFSKLVTHALNMMTGYSTAPLRLASLVGFGFTLFGLGVLAYVLGRYLISGSAVAGFPFLASIIAIFSGAQLFALGIMGEYLARMHGRMMDRPTYTVREQTAARQP